MSNFIKSVLIAIATITGTIPLACLPLGCGVISEPAGVAIAGHLLTDHSHPEVTDGNDGADGMDGSDGAPGQDGSDGQDGGEGRMGASGPQGPSGPQGANGQDGFNQETTILVVVGPKDGLAICCGDDEPFMLCAADIAFEVFLGGCFQCGVLQNGCGE